MLPVAERDPYPNANTASYGKHGCDGQRDQNLTSSIHHFRKLKLETGILPDLTSSKNVPGLPRALALSPS